jgi:ribosomal protein S18 acetylase RimI-like enzyme
LSPARTIELERIYVGKEFHGSGLGFQLIKRSEEFARDNRYSTMWLGVWKRNQKAMRFYEKCGFEIFDEHIFILGKDEQVDWLMKKELKD